MTASLPLVPVVIVAAFFIFFIWAAARENQLVVEHLRQLAAKFGLEAHAPTASKVGSQRARASGNWRGRPLEFFSYTTGAGKTRTNWCAVAVTARSDGGLTVALQRQGLGTKVQEMFGASEITVGDPAFDQRWFIQTNQPEFLRAALLPELRAKIEAVASGPGIRGMKLEFERGQARYSEQGTFSNTALVARIAQAAEVVADLADVAEVAAGPRR